MTAKGFALLTFVFFAADFAIAAPSNDCSPIDLNTNTALKDMSILDQDGSGLCYAYASAQAIEYELRSAGQNRTVSAVDLALLTGTKCQEHFNRSSLTGGAAQDVLNCAGRYGTVPRSCIDEEVKAFTRDSYETSEKFTHLLDVVYANENIFISQNKELSKMNKVLMQDPYIHDCKIPTTLDLLAREDLFGSSVTKVLQTVLYACEKKREPIPGFKYFEINFGTDQELKKTLDPILARKKPALINLCAEVFDNPRHRGLTNSSPPLFRYEPGNLRNCSQHEVLIVGRRSEQDKCMYLVRNSWGAGWHPKELKCACKTPDGSYYPDCDTLEELENKKRLAVNDPKNRPIQDELVKKYEESSRQYINRVSVGCWVDEKNLLPNLLGIGSLR